MRAIALSACWLGVRRFLLCIEAFDVVPHSSHRRPAPSSHRSPYLALLLALLSPPSRLRRGSSLRQARQRLLLAQHAALTPRRRSLRWLGRCHGRGQEGLGKHAVATFFFARALQRALPCREMRRHERSLTSYFGGLVAGTLTASSNKIHRDHPIDRHATEPRKRILHGYTAARDWRALALTQVHHGEPKQNLSPHQG